LIAGTYAPYTLLAVGGEVGWLLFKLTWLFALLGVVLKIFFTGKFNFLSTVLYVLMGWQIVFAATPFLENNPVELVLLVFLGGISYTLGAILYSIDKIPFNHAIFHVFVLVGSICHFWGCYVYL
jgi:hemolysin III